MLLDRRSPEQPSQPRDIEPKMPTVPMLRNPGLEHFNFYKEVGFKYYLQSQKLIFFLKDVVDIVMCCPHSPSGPVTYPPSCREPWLLLTHISGEFSRNCP